MTTTHVGWRDDIGDVFAQELYVRAGYQPHTAPGAARLAIAILGDGCIATAPSAELPGGALLKRVGYQWVICVGETLNARQLNHAVAHELAEWFLRCRGYAEADVEEFSTRVAAAICVPKLAFLAAHTRRGDDWRALAAEFQVSESLMALRSAECLGEPTALITPGIVRTRGKPWAWPSAREDWVALITRARSNESGLTLRTLNDAPDRVVLRAR